MREFYKLRSFCNLSSYRPTRKSFLKENVVFKAKKANLSSEGSGREFRDCHF